MAIDSDYVFGKLSAVTQPPNLIEIQTKSFADFLQSDVLAGERENQGLQAIFNEVFPVVSKDGAYKLEFVRYNLETPRKTAFEALRDGDTFAAPLHAKFRLTYGGMDREDDVFMGDIPLMTRDGAFIINGAERVIVSQLHRSPGVCSEKTIHANGRELHSVRIIPDHGSWIEIQFDASDVMWVYLDRRRRTRKFYVTTFLRTLGYSDDESILRLFYTFHTISTADRWPDDELASYVLKDDLIDINTGSVLGRRYEPVTPTTVESAARAGIPMFDVVDTSFDKGLLLKTLKMDPTHSEEEAVKDIYHRLRPGDPVTAANARSYVRNQFFDPRRYDLGYVGRYKVNQRLDLMDKVDLNLRILSEDGIEVVEALRLLLNITVGREIVDDIDHLGNRRIRTTGELLEQACRMGLSRTERLIRERMSTIDSSQQLNGLPSPVRLVTSKSLSAVIQDFFGRSQLSQFMDMTNPLSALAHKRRLSALGPGGLSRERAGFEVRDVHPTHYGRICPIETPEGPNIGLISSLGIYARINEYGFIETPYRVVKDGQVTDEIRYIDADEEEKYVIAQANAPLDENSRFVKSVVKVRRRGEFTTTSPDEIDLMDVSPMQVISIAAGLIPFLEHDDANRALMGANMMRQGVPLMRTERPRVGTGLEGIAAADSCVTVLAEEDGIVAYVSATEIIVSKDGKVPARVRKGEKEAGCRRYVLEKFRRSNAGTCVNQKPIVKLGEPVKKGQTLADGPATDAGELALGKNLLVAFMPWRGFNFEDAILINERCVKDDTFTSVHIKDFECFARDTKLGPEEITRDIPNVGEDMLRNLGFDGVVRVGAEVKQGDILVGKITPKSETELAPEERLLRAIFGEKAADVRDTSLKVPPGTKGVVMDVRTTNADSSLAQKTKKATKAPKGALMDDGDEAHSYLEDEAMPANAAETEVRRIEDIRNRRKSAIYDDMVKTFSKDWMGAKFTVDIRDANGEIVIPKNRKITKNHLMKLAETCNNLQMIADPNIQSRIEEVQNLFVPRFAELDMIGIDGLGEDGLLDEERVVKQVRVFIAEKKNLSVGDKLAGRHGNKGVVSRILPDCDMPFLPDGRSVDIVLNPLGVPSRMNLGQLFETVLGGACSELDMHVKTPVFDGCQESEIDDLLAKARRHQEENTAPGSVPWISPDGKTQLFDGLTGEPFSQRVVVGTIYMLKLHHLVTDKIHARATGPYSLVTQQPLGGKAQAGGQRMGEMEVWALEAYGVAYALQELLTVKSDDVVGRTRIYETIVKGTNTLEAGTPESFAVLVSELRGLCLDMKLLGGKATEEENEADSLTASAATPSLTL